MRKFYFIFGFASPAAFRCSSIKPVFERSQIRELIEQSKFSSQILMNISRLESNLNIFKNNFETYRQVAEKSSIHNAALFARTCLIAETYKYVRKQQYYPMVKKAINAKIKELRPFNALVLLQLFSYFKWQGDQYKIIDQLMKFYEQKCYLFNRGEQIGFWEFYVKIMGKKIHDTSKFQNLERRKNQTIQVCSLKFIVQKLINLKQVNKKIIKQIIFDKEQEIMVRLKKPGSDNLEIVFKIRPILDFNQYSTQQYQSLSYNFQLKRTILTEAKSLESALKKGWNLFLLGIPYASQDKDIDYQYTIKQGYVGTEKITKNLDGSQENLNNFEKLDSLRLSPKYVSGIFYNSTDPNKRMIDTNSTIFLSIASKYFSNRYIKFFQQRKYASHLISPYLTTNQLKQIYGLSKNCEFYQEFFDSYIKIQSLMSKLMDQQVKRKYMIYEMQAFMNESRMNKEERKLFLSSNPQLLTELTMEDANETRNLIFSNKCTWSQRQVNSSLANNCKEQFWQAQPLFPEVARMIQAAQQIHLNQKNSKTEEKNIIKVKVIIPRRKFPYFIKHLLGSKYWTVPKLSFQNIDKPQKELRSTLLTQIF